ncbi:MAG TPA: META domain-containing protein [Dysgonomonas sp.]|nr:META domain-containing protein [Dysgonomonas sp.]
MKTKNSMKLFIALIAVFFSALAFHSCTSTTPLTREQMEGYWVLKTLNGQDARSQFAGALPTLQFNFDDNTISGTGGCNRYSGPYTYKEGILSAPNLASTRMLCTENNNESEYLLQLSGTNNVLSIQNDLLTITKDGRVIMEFEKGSAPAENYQVNAESLKGTWTLKTIDGAQASDSYTTEGGKIPTISFNFDDNRVFGNAGCNNFNASFTLGENGQVIISRPASTMMACPNMEGENKFMQAISDTSMITLPDANTLQFAKGDMVSVIFEKTSNETI